MLALFLDRSLKRLIKKFRVKSLSLLSYQGVSLDANKRFPYVVDSECQHLLPMLLYFFTDSLPN